MTRQFAAAHTREDIRGSVTRHLQNLLGRESTLLLPDPTGRLDAGSDAPSLTERDRTVAQWVFEHGQPAGFGTSTLPGGPWSFRPVGQDPPRGVFGLHARPDQRTLSPSESQLLETAVGQTAAALERIRSSERAETLRVGMETEKARSTLLSLVSHDLRTPLASIGGAAETLLSDGGRLAGDERRGLLESIRNETARLGRLIGDILEITRLQSGALALRRERYPLDELIDSAIDQVETALRGRSVQVRLPSEMIFVEADATILTRVFVNLLDQRGPPHAAGDPGRGGGRDRRGPVRVSVLDRGPGIPPGRRSGCSRCSIARRRGGAGAGLGLALSAAIVGAHGGDIHAESRPGAGRSSRWSSRAPGHPARFRYGGMT